jgi:hypothetical protein
MAFGAIILFEVASYFRRGLIDRYFVEPVFNFTYPGFGWLLLAVYPNWTRHFGKHVMTFQKGVKQWSPSGGARMVAVVSVQSFANRLFFERAVRSNQLRISVVVLGGEAAKWLSDLTKVSHELALTAPAYEISTVLSSTALPGPIFTSHRGEAAEGRRVARVSTAGAAPSTFLKLTVNGECHAPDWNDPK